ncbi:rhamnose ABC transporter substrate-binding protein [Pseudogracilibacillus sp. SO10305]|uniref:rhamnose ABC transporter substrate-binding protein n=1 Tax=Pseudogracilibacillus sp. SO10305 TaxID=3098292 RepID=UPI00300DD5F5
MRRKLSFLFTIVAMFVLVLGACSNDAAKNKGNSGEADGEGGKRHAIVYKNTGNPFGEKLMDGFKDAIESNGDEAILRAPDSPTVEGQVQIIEELITQQVDSITVAGNDEDALEPVLKKAMEQGIKVLSTDSAVNENSRLVHVNQADPEGVGRVQIEAIAEMIDYEGEIAVLSATSQATNQNLWIEWMEEELKDDKYKDMELVKVAYGDDLRDKSVSETEALLKSYPDLKGLVSPTTVGLAAASKVITDKGVQDDIKITGLGLPSEMAEYISSGVAPWIYLWNPIELGYLAGETAIALSDETIEGNAGDTFEVEGLGEFEVVESETGEGTEVLLGEPFKFDAENIDEWKDVY